MLFNSTSAQSIINTDSTIDRRALSRDWEMAQERILLYLRCMNVPPGEKRLMLALEALRHANEDKSKVNDILPAVVQRVRALVKDKTQEGAPGKNISEGPLGKYWSMPPLNRRTMIPIEFDQVPERFATESFLKRIVLQFRPLILPVFFLLNLLLFLGLFWIKKVH